MCCDLTFYYDRSWWKYIMAPYDTTSIFLGNIWFSSYKIFDPFDWNSDWQIKMLLLFLDLRSSSIVIVDRRVLHRSIDDVVERWYLFRIFDPFDWNENGRRPGLLVGFLSVFHVLEGERLIVTRGLRFSNQQSTDVQNSFNGRRWWKQTNVMSFSLPRLKYVY